jgi:DNA primase catalytic core
MARIPQQEIERLKREVSLQRLVERYGIELKRHGADLHGLCPFHEDKEPSLVISPSKNLWHCLGACQAGGSVIDWVMKAEGVSFRHAVELLHQDLPLAGGVQPAKHSTVRKMPLPFDRTVEDEELLGQVIGFYHETLKQSPEALSYLQKRGIGGQETIERFKLGFANRSLGYRLPDKNRKAGAEVRGRLQKLGILRESGHEHFNGSLVIPVLDENGRVLAVYGRKVTPHLRSGTPDHLYLPGPHRGVFNVQALAVSTEIILCEALIDALTFWCAGFRNVTSSYGVEGFTKAHLEAFKRYGTRRVLIAYDRDEAGDKAAATLASKLMRELSLECFRIQFPRGMDANEYAQKVQPAHKSLELVIRQAMWMGKGEAPERLVAPIAFEPPAPMQNEPPLPEVKAAAEAAPEVSSAPEGRFPDEKTDSAEVAVVGGEAVSPLAAHDDDASNDAPRDEVVASPMPVMTPVAVEAETAGDEVRIQLGDRRWRIRGMSRNLSVELLRVNVLVSRPDAERGQAFFVDTLDLYSARQRSLFIKEAADELGVEPKVIKRDLGRVLLKLEELQEQAIAAAAAPKEAAPAPMPERARAAAMAFLEDEHLLERILSDFERCGVVGEQTNKLVGYLTAVSRKLEEPLAVVIQSSSAAGKTSLMEAVLAFFPEEERVKYSAMTGQSLFYMGERDLAHKILAIVEEEGAERATYALKLLQSERELTIASTGKDPTTGRLVTHEYRVEGPVAIFLTTTAVEIDEELQNRCIVLTVDEEREQTRAIHRSQRQQQTLEGMLARRARDGVLEVHRNAQRLLRPLLVANPFAEKLTFLDSRTRTRRDHMKYLTLIRAIALLHQYQRPQKTVLHEGAEVPYIEVTLGDIAVANQLAHQVMGHSLDELAPQTRRLLELISELVGQACKRLEMDRGDYRFTRREVREHTGWGPTQVRVHLERLVELEYVLVHHGGRGQQFVYELLFDGASGREVQLAGLAEVEALRTDEPTTSNLAGLGGDLAGGWRGHGGPKTGGWRGGGNGQSGRHVGALSAAAPEPDGNAHLESRPKGRSYTLHRRSDVLAADQG